MRPEGLFSFPATLEVKSAGDLDARKQVPTYADLISGEKADFYFVGITVTVTEDTDETKRGVYRLDAKPVTDAANWKKLAEGGTDVGVTVHSDLTGLDYDSAGHTGFQAELSTEQLANIDAVPTLQTAIGNVYTKSESYSATEVDDLLSAAASGQFVKVTELPAVGEVGKIYLVPKVDDPTTNDEFVWLADTEVYEQIGDTALSLDGYVEDPEITIESTETTTEPFGAIPVGTALTDKTVKDILMDALFAEKFPTLTGPSVRMTSSLPTLIESNSTLSTTFNIVFNYGSINPQYTATSPNRAGAVNKYNLTGAQVPTELVTTEGTATTDLTDYVFSTLGAVAWSCTASYDAGVQPKSSKGNDFGTPLVAGTTAASTVSVTVVNPVFATTTDITTPSKLALMAPTVSYIEVDVAEETDSAKQVIQFGKEMGTLTRVDQLNTLSGKWETIALSSFTVADVAIEINGVSQAYSQVVHNGSKSGARSLRLYV